MSSYVGQCLCGEVRYKVDKIESHMAHCHCTMCRKFHGAAFATYGEAKLKNFHWLKGESLLKSYEAQNGTIRKFCSNCGSSMIFVPSNDNGELIEFSLGTLNDDIEHKPDAHIFIQSKANWYEIFDSLPQFDTDRK